jgi:hypothetical protein
MITLPDDFLLPNNPLIGWHNVVTASSLTADQESATAPVTQLANPATYNPWSGTTAVEQSVTVSLAAATTIDYVGIAQHNLGTAGITYFLEYSSNSVDWTEAANGTPVDDGVIIHVIDPISAQFWRVRFSAGTESPAAAVLYLGEILQITRRVYVGHTPITLGRKTGTRPGRSENGQYLGRVVARRLYACEVSIDNLDPDWYREYFDPFALNAEDFPFFWAWRPETYPDEVAYAWTTSDITPDNQRPNGMMRVSFPIEGITGTLSALSSFSSS